MYVQNSAELNPICVWDEGELKRVAIVGLDGVNLKNALVLVKSFGARNLARILSKGFISESIAVPPYTPIIWTSIFSGVNAGKHGIFGFMKISRSKFPKLMLNTAWDVHYPRIFEILSLHNLKSIIANIPLTYPLDGVIRNENLIMISDWASPVQFIHPRDICERYREHLKPPPHKWHQATNVKKYVRIVQNFLQHRLEIYYDLLDRTDITLLAVIFSELDWLMHRIPRMIVGDGLNLVNKVVSLIDEFIGTLMEQFDLIVVVSDHGFRVCRRILNVNSALAEEGLYRYKLKLNFEKIGRTLGNLTASLDGDAMSKISGNIMRLMSNVLSSRVIKLFASAFPDKAKSRLPVSIEHDLLTSKALMIEPDSWSIHLLDKRKEIRLKIINVFRNAEGVKLILFASEIFWGNLIKFSPDLVLVPDDYTSFSTSISRSTLEDKIVGDHHMKRMLLLYGDHVVKGRINNEITTFDLAPTVLAYLNLPIPHDVDGKVLEEAFNISLNIRKVNYSSVYRTVKKCKLASYL